MAPPKRRACRRRLTPSEPTGPLMEFRAIEDDAWYSCSTRVEEDGGCYVDETNEGLETYLRIMFSGFGEELDQRFPAGMFEDAAEIEEFRDRFRPHSKQLQDWECRDVVTGTKVCASSVLKGKSENDDVKFYDAVVEKITHLDHKFDNGNEICTCKFMLLWSHGPNKGRLTPRHLENICIVHEKREPCDQGVDYFLAIATKKLSQTQASLCANTVPRLELGSHTLANGSTQVSNDVSMTKRYTGVACELMQTMSHHVDLGGSANLQEPTANGKEGFYFIVVENMENNLLPATIVEFIQRETSVHAQAMVFPSFYSESYSRGIIFVDTRGKIFKIAEFCGNSDQLIVSSSGRPWVIAEKKYSYGSIVGLLSEFQIQSRVKGDESRVSLQLARKGTKEFEKGKKRYDMFIEFHKHIQALHQALIAKERVFDS